MTAKPDKFTDLIIEIAARIESAKKDLAQAKREFYLLARQMEAEDTGAEQQPKPSPKPKQAKPSSRRANRLSRERKYGTHRQHPHDIPERAQIEYRYIGNEYLLAARELRHGTRGTVRRDGKSSPAIWLTDGEADACLLNIYAKRARRGGPRGAEYQRKLTNLKSRLDA